MEIKNMTDQNVNEIAAVIEKMREDNPAIDAKVFTMEDWEKKNLINEKIDKTGEQLKLIAERFDALETKINHIFAGHVLIDGKFIQPIIE